MIEGSLSRRYAKALFELALEGHREEEIGQEIKWFVTAYTTSPLMKVLNNPVFTVRGRKDIIVEVAKGLRLSLVVIHFLSFLLEQGRLAFLPSIVSRYRRLLDERKGRVEARVVTTSPLEKDMIERLREVLQEISGKEVVLQEETDPGLIGGLLIQLEGKVYDGSVRTQLEGMRKRIERGY
jgi:F-type H+-transporting ATPase subunit delta